ncbi:Hypothetical protein CINCED_3A004162 [Cinara cedri]|uniref:Uncharacterized protein n=1 Tax=Cinara cedri TaxID=506608 RepID=A0A5E4MVU0_9HEMI|nr:Hypothetical protein CINCED_3A004162 [Cinara cedri]
MLSKVQWSLCEPVSKIQGDTQNYSSMMEKDSQTENDNISLNIVLNIADGDPLRYIRIYSVSQLNLQLSYPLLKKIQFGQTLTTSMMSF